LSTPTGPILLVAGDVGPRSAVYPLLSTTLAIRGWDEDARARKDGDWLDLINLRSVRGLVCGTSDSPDGRSLEAGARRAAVSAGIPVLVIEDFPGNYYEVPGGQAGLLIVESPAAAEFTRRKFAASAPRIKILGSARYDLLRRTAVSHRNLMREKHAAQSRIVSILWAGQPETSDCLATLEALLPSLARREFELLFKAHPRDSGYASGAYDSLLANAGINYRDVTLLSVENSLLLAPKLAVTQFSSTAIEAGFFGIPSLNVLLPDAGGARLLAKKGYRIPPHCAKGAASYAMHSNELEYLLNQLIDDNTARENLIRCFDSYFCTCELMLPHLSTLVENFF
jgi:hypothetical protein